MWWIILLIVLGSLILITIIFAISISGYIAKSLIRPRYKTREGQIKDRNHTSWPGYNDLKKKPFNIQLRDGYIIHGDYSPNGDSKKTMIIVHGHGSTREGTTKYGLIYFKLGYNIVRYDVRGHGDNLRTRCTMGDIESKDLDEIINYVQETYQPESISLHGTSMGGATVLLTISRYNKNIKFAVVDCPYSNVSRLAGDFASMKHQPRFLFIPFFNVIMKMCRMNIKNASPEYFVKDNITPTLFVHGAKDDFVLPYHHDILFKNNNGVKEEHIFPHGTHGNSVFDDAEEYKNVIEEFVKKYQ